MRKNLVQTRLGGEFWTSDVITHKAYYLTDTLEKLNSAGKRGCLLGDFNLCLLKTPTSHYSPDFLTTLEGNYLIPTIDKPTRVHRTTATLIENIFVNNPEQVLLSGNIITDVSGARFSKLPVITGPVKQFCFPFQMGVLKIIQ